MARVLNTAVVGLITLSGVALARLAWAQDGVAANPIPPLVPAAPAAHAPSSGVPVDEAIRLDEYLNRLEEWRIQGRITAVESARARQVLHAAVINRDRSVSVPMDASGRIDLLALARGKSEGANASARPADRLAARVVNEFDLRMQLKARDMAHPGSLALFDAAPGYVRVPARDLGHIAKSALESTPLREMPGGTRLASAVGSLPNVSGAKADHNMRELSRLVGDRQSDWLRRSGVGRFLDGHRIQAGLIAFGAITGLRMSSPETARAIDRFGLRLRFARLSTHDARMYTTGRLIYRNGHVLPELELESGARHVAGVTTYRATVSGIMGAQASQQARGRFALGARWERGRLFADTNAMYAFPESLTRTEVRGGYLTETGLAVSAAVGATFGRGSGAVGDAPGRLGYELDLTKTMAAGSARGEAGLFISTFADSDFTHTDGRAGFVLRLRF